MNKNKYFFWLIAFMLPLISACSSSNNAPHRVAPISYIGSQSPTIVNTSRALTENVAYGRTTSGQGVVSVLEGDTVYEISRRYGVSMRELITRNDLRPPYILHIGDRIILPPPHSYTVQHGDSLWGIAQTFDTSLYQIARQNNLTPPYILQPGQTIILPSETVRGSTPSTPPPAPTSNYASNINIPPPSPQAPRRTRWLPPINPQTPNINPQTTPITTPPPVITSTNTNTAPIPPHSPRTSIPTTTPPPATPVSTTVTATNNNNNTAPRPTRSMRGQVPQQPPARSSSRFSWPIEGRIISDFGPKPGGLHNDGINIASSRGTRVSAAENGIVAYAGNEIRGFGNLVLIRHSDGWMTAYAHLDNIAVGRGTTVNRGQAIGTVGSTGSVEQPQLHFEVRRGATAINPNDYL